MNSSCIKKSLNKLKSSVVANKSKSFGYAFTALWILFVFLQASGKWGSLELNARGDFLAGFFSPLAFLWLVLGYFQQGEELRLNTKAIELQIQELKQSVEQQRIVAESTKTAYKAEYIRSQPILTLSISGKISKLTKDDSRLRATTIKVYNSGYTARDLSLESCYDDVKVSPKLIQIAESKSNNFFEVTYREEDEIDSLAAFILNYTDGMSNQKRSAYLRNGEKEFLKILG